MPHHHSALLGAVLVATALGCGDTTRQGPGGEINLQVIDGEDQIGREGEELPNPIVVRVTDHGGQRVSGVLINFVVTAGGGHVFAGAALTNSDGEARERWTLGFERDNVIEARGVDQATGDAIVYATIRATAMPEPPGPPAALYLDPLYRSQYRLMGQEVRLRDFVFVADDKGQPIPDAPLTISPAPGILVDGTTVRADAALGREVVGMVEVSVASLSDSFRVAFLPDFTQHRWRATYSCFQPFVHYPELDSIVNVVALSDSVRQAPNQISADDTYRGLELTFYMKATGTLYYHDGRVVQGEVPSDLAGKIPAYLFPHRIEYGRAIDPWNAGYPGIKYSPATSDGTLPPTYLGGDLCADRFVGYTPGVFEPIP
jgi:hypothetical protein